MNSAILIVSVIVTFLATRLLTERAFRKSSDMKTTEAMIALHDEALTLLRDTKAETGSVQIALDRAVAALEEREIKIDRMVERGEKFIQKLDGMSKLEEGFAQVEKPLHWWER